MNRILLLLMLVTAGCSAPVGTPPSTNPAAANPAATNQASTNQAAANPAATSRILLIGPSSMPVAAGKVTLTIGPLKRANGVYTGDYKIKVFPYFYKNEQGRLAIVVSDKSLTGINQGKATAIIGTATTSGKGGSSRHIDATATPSDINHGTIKLTFTTAGNRKMIFGPAYHFAGEETTTVPAQTTTKL
ncbi:MAG TPA: hypothetical protein VIK53_15135 [Verrucomicrobiae bacterium]